MTRMTRPDCVVMCNLINIHTHTRMTRMTRPDCAVMCNLINTRIHTHTFEDSSGDGNGDDDNGNENDNRIGESGREAKKRKKPQNSCRPRAGNGGDTGGKR